MVADEFGRRGARTPERAQAGSGRLVHQRVGTVGYGIHGVGIFRARWDATALLGGNVCYQQGGQHVGNPLGESVTGGRSLDRGR